MVEFVLEDFHSDITSAEWPPGVQTRIANRCIGTRFKGRARKMANRTSDENLAASGPKRVKKCRSPCGWKKVCQIGRKFEFSDGGKLSYSFTFNCKFGMPTSWPLDVVLRMRMEKYATKIHNRKRKTKLFTRMFGENEMKIIDANELPCHQSRPNWEIVAIKEY